MMKQIVFLAVSVIALQGCGSATTKAVVASVAASATSKAVTAKTGKTVRSPSTSKRTSSKSSKGSIPVVNSTLPECRGITLHKAMVYHEPFRYGGRVMATIPVYRIVISNAGKRRKVIFDIDYTASYGNRKYGSYQTRSGTKEHKPITLRTGDMNAIYNIGSAEKREKYTKIAVVDCV